MLDHQRPSTTAIAALTAVCLAWGGFAFGGVYPWAYIPLLGVATLVSLLCLVTSRDRPWNAGLVAPLGLLAAAVIVQVFPLPFSVVETLSPHAAPLIRDLNPLSDPPRFHPLSIAPRQTWLGLAFLGTFGVLLVTLSRRLSPRLVRRLAYLITVVGGALAVTGIVQRAAGPSAVLGFWLPQNARTNPFGPFINKNHFAGWMIMALPVAAGLVLGVVQEAFRRRASVAARRWLLWWASADGTVVIVGTLVLFAMALSIALTMSRSGLTVLALLIVTMIAIVKRSRSARTGSQAAALAAIGVLVAAWAGAGSIARLFASPGTRDLSGRLSVWSESLPIAKDFALTGTGFNTYGVASLFYAIGDGTTHFREAHNEYLQIAIEGGLLVGVPAAGVLLAIVMVIRSRLRSAEDPDIRWIRTGAILGLAAIATQSVAEFSLQMPGNAVLFVVLCAIAVHQPGQSTRRLTGLRTTP